MDLADVGMITAVTHEPPRQSDGAVCVLPSLLDLTPYSSRYRQDPHPVLDDLRRRCPAHWDEASKNWIFTRSADIRPLLTDRSLWRDPLRADADALLRRRGMPRAETGCPRSHLTNILTLDDPDHERIRAPFAQALYRRAAALRPEIACLVDEVLDGLDTTAPFDLIDSFCTPIPILAIARILGVEAERLAAFRLWSDAVIHALNPFRSRSQTVAVGRAQQALNSYFAEMIAARRSHPRPDLISDLVRLQADGAEIDDVELNLNLQALLIGGNLTTSDLIGNTVRNLLLHPREFAKLQADPSLVGAAVEEGLRFESPVDMTARVAPCGFEAGGQRLRPGDAITLSLRAANRDPEVFADPHEFNISRKRQPHVAFGGGAHTCIGAPLARQETSLALSKLFARFPGLRLAEPEAPAAWRQVAFFRGLEHLQVVA